MNNLLSADSDLPCLLDALIDGHLTELDRTNLSRLLATDVAARQLYCRYIALHTLLQGEQAQPLGLPKALNALTASPQPASRSPVLGFLASVSRHVPGGEFTVGSLLLLVIVAAFWGLSQAILFPKLGGHDLAEDSSHPAVATIRDEANAQWSPDSRVTDSSTSRSASITAGQPLSITAGLIQLQLASGATLLIEGPADWQIDGENSATLKHGKLVAKVPQQAIGFTLNTPTARIVDLGTEFGVMVGAPEHAEVRVFVGDVHVFPDKPGNAPSTSPRAPISLTAGETIRITRANDESTQSETASPETHFTRLLPRDRSVALEDRYAQCVMPLRPLLYFRMSQGDTALGKGLLDAPSGKVLGKLEFQRDLPQVFVNVPFGEAMRFNPDSSDSPDQIVVPTLAGGGPLTFSRGAEQALPFTLALWAMCDPTAGEEGALLAKGLGCFEQFALTAIPNAGIRFFARAHDTSLLFEMHSKARMDGTWQHVAACYDPGLGIARLYVNGQLEASANVPLSTLLETSDPLRIGNRIWPSGHTKNFPFHGVIDEVAIFARALTPTEIQELYLLKSSSPPEQAASEATQR